jgi:DNA/RNA endonuclease YhcR with UshA esterase domain
MKNILARVAVIALVAAGASGCALSLRNPDIADLQRHPGRYENQTVTVNGVVTSSWGLPLVPFRFYKVDDGTGEVTVLSEGSRMPAKGERVRVKGRVEEVAVLGGRPLGLHLRERDLYVKR